PARSGDKGLSKMEAVRRALNDLGPKAMPADIISHVKQKYDIVLSSTMASSYKNSISRKGAGESGLVRRGRGAAPAAAAAVPAPSPRISLDDLRAVKQLSDRIGVDKVLQLAQVLAK